MDGPFSIPPAPFGGIDGSKLVHVVGRRDHHRDGRQRSHKLTSKFEGGGGSLFRVRRHNTWCTLALHSAYEFRDDVIARTLKHHTRDATPFLLNVLVFRATRRGTHSLSVAPRSFLSAPAVLTKG